jgi:hypothetical protein
LFFISRCSSVALVDHVLHMGEDLKKARNPKRAARFFAKARELEKRSRTFHDAVLAHESGSGDNLGQHVE